MQFYNGDLVELPKKGFAIIITDIHGNLTDYNKFINIWENFEGKDNHLIITGDFIHGVGRENDQSVKVLESVKSNFENYSNFHALLGNHEWSVISDVAVYKGGENLSHNFEILLKQRFQDKWKVKLEEYINFFKQLPLAVKTDNKVFISHGGPSKLVKNLGDIINLTDEGYSNERLRELLWNRYGDYDKKDIDLFLKNVGCNAMIVGHTPVDGAKLIGKNQLVVSSSFSRGKKAYVELDLEKKIKNAKDIKKMVRYLD